MGTMRNTSFAEAPGRSQAGTRASQKTAGKVSAAAGTGPGRLRRPRASASQLEFWAGPAPHVSVRHLGTECGQA
jgi:hypothetical protein